MARWVLSPIDGDGSLPAPGQTDAEGPYRPHARKYGSGVPAWLVGDDGKPAGGWCLFRVDRVTDLAGAQADDTIRILPDWTLDHVLTAGEAAGVTSALGKFGITGPSPTGRTVRQVLRWLADQLDATWQGI